MDDAGLPALLDAIRHLEGCEATWIESVPVHETHEGQTVWTGDVQVFDLVKHPKAKRAYAWSHATTGTRRQVRDDSSTSCFIFPPWTVR